MVCNFAFSIFFDYQVVTFLGAYVRKHQRLTKLYDGKVTFKYFLAKDSFVKLEIVSLTGIVIASIVSEAQSAGFYEINYDAGYLANGVFLYTLINKLAENGWEFVTLFQDSNTNLVTYYFRKEFSSEPN